MKQCWCHSVLWQWFALTYTNEHITSSKYSRKYCDCQFPL